MGAETQRRRQKHNVGGKQVVLKIIFDAPMAGMKLDDREVLNEGEMRNYNAWMVFL